MRYIRSFFTVFCFAIFGIGGFLIGTVIFPLTLLIVPKKNQRYVLINTVHYSWKIFVFVMSFFRLIKVKVENKEKIKNLKGRVVVANHPSLIDIVLLISIVPNSVCIVKGKLANNFFIKHIIRRVARFFEHIPCDFFGFFLFFHTTILPDFFRFYAPQKI